MPTQEVNCNMAPVVTSANCAQAINTARRDRFEAGEKGGSRPVCFPLLFWALTAAHDSDHWSQFSVFRATTSPHELVSVYLNPPELPLIFCHLVHLAQAVRIGFVFLLKWSWHPRFSFPPAGWELSHVCVHSVWGAAPTPGEQGTLRHLAQPASASKVLTERRSEHPLLQLKSNGNCRQMKVLQIRKWEPLSLKHCASLQSIHVKQVLLQSLQS